MKIKERKPKVNLSPLVIDQLKNVTQTLKARGACKVDIGELIERLFFQDSTIDVINDFVSEKTPTEYKLKALLNDPEAKEKLLRVIGDRNFGVESANLAANAQPRA